MTNQELQVAQSFLSNSGAFYRCGDKCLIASNDVAILPDEIQPLIDFLHSDLDSVDFSPGEEDAFIAYSKIFSSLKELQRLKLS